nr:MAG TPA: hypothetical protein [Caudoviricetes sp.]
MSVSSTNPPALPSSDHTGVMAFVFLLASGDF